MKRVAKDGHSGKYVQSAGKRRRLVAPTAYLEWPCEGGCGKLIDSGKVCQDCEEGFCECGNTKRRDMPVCEECL